MTPAELEEKMRRLNQANHVRIVNARFLKDITKMSTADGRAVVVKTLLDPSPEQWAIPLHRLLGSIRRLGVVKTSAFCTGIGVRSADRRIRDLTDRQRFRLCDLLEES